MANKKLSDQQKAVVAEIKKKKQARLKKKRSMRTEQRAKRQNHLSETRLREKEKTAAEKSLKSMSN